ncbi:protohypothetical protein [Limosa lapponica baueri]|uniref:Uncharacterized protein n=1 Tax=Limosa lapponica baueri TaxID=1758121 RepID=A0A2I0UE47_LIMLA|nr:protohypothetical protein [Limosa lapponica baueri]
MAVKTENIENLLAFYQTPKLNKSQRRVTFHLPDGSQESCSDSGLGDHEPVGGGTLISHPLPLVQPQDEFYDQASPDKRTEADGNSDPNSAAAATQDQKLQVLSSELKSLDGPRGLFRLTVSNGVLAVQLLFMMANTLLKERLDPYCLQDLKKVFKFIEKD